MRLGERSLRDRVEVLPGTDVEGVWQRFEVFEALHNGMQICNPLTDADFEALVEATAVRDGHRVLDVACGYGEFVVRCAERAAIRGTGIDLSPWMLQGAVVRADDRLSDPDRVRWLLGEARDFLPEEPCDLAICLGAEWIWHGFNGTARALAERVRPGGIVVIGATRLKAGRDPKDVALSHGRIETIADRDQQLQSHGLESILRLDPDDAAWDAYVSRTETGVQRWAAALPGPATDDYVATQHEWQEARDRDRDVMGWSAWVARVVG